MARETGKDGFQRRLIERLEKLFPGCFILKNDTSYLQGVPDLIILYEDKWAMLEVKASVTSLPEPNQPYYVATLNAMSYAAFVYPENVEDVLNALQHTFRPDGTPRVPVG